MKKQYFNHKICFEGSEKKYNYIIKRVDFVKILDLDG